MNEWLLSIRDLVVEFRTYAGVVHALNGASLELRRGEALGLVGETGCGKSTIGLAILRLLPRGGEIVSGSMEFAGEDLLAKPESELQAVRGARIAMIFQDPAASLNPLYTVGEQIAMVVRRHQPRSKTPVQRQVLDLLRTVELPDPDRTFGCYPHELSGGMLQRVSIALALSSGAELLIADEPTTALDVTIQAQILDLLGRLRNSQGLTLLLITHDLAVVAETCQRVAVLYSGCVVERGPVERVLQAAGHPYTQALLQAVPQPSDRGLPLRAIPGPVPSGLEPPEGCLYRPRCPEAMPMCSRRPGLRAASPDHFVACHRYLAVDGT